MWSERQTERSEFLEQFIIGTIKRETWGRAEEKLTSGQTILIYNINNNNNNNYIVFGNISS